MQRRKALGGRETNPVAPLKAHQREALQLVIDGYRLKEVGDKLGISMPTLYRWRQMPAWQAALDEAIGEVEGEGSQMIRVMLPQAMQTLHKLMVAGSEGVKLGAARTVLEAYSQLVQRQEQQELIKELEARLEEVSVVAGQAPPGEVFDADFRALAPELAHNSDKQGEAA